MAQEEAKTTTAEDTDGQIKQAYNRLVPDRSFYLKEAHESAKLTIPSVIPSDQDAAQKVGESPDILEKPWQSLGARGVRNLASKLGLTLFPPTGSFMRYQLHPEIEEEMDAGGEGKRTEIEEGLARREQIIMDEVEKRHIRTKADMALRHLIIAGNVLVYLPPSGGMRVFPLNHYVVRRDFTGNLVEIIYLEVLDRSTLPSKYAKVLIAQGAAEAVEGHDDKLAVDPTTKQKKSIVLYTRLLLDGKSFKTSQEVDGFSVPDADGSIPQEKMPYLALRFVTVDGEDYGRGYVEEFRGDLRSLEQLRHGIVVASINAAKLVGIVNPNSSLTPKKLHAARNGQFVLGRPDDVTFLQQAKHADMSVAQSTAADISKDLSASFLLNSSFQRQAERVTAEEIRRMAEELEDALGGVFSVLSQELQLPLALRIDEQLVKAKTLDPLPKEAVQPVVVTGLAAIGRGHEFNRLREFAGFLTELSTLMPGIGGTLKPLDWAKRGGIGVGVETDDLLKTEEELQAEAQAARQAEFRQQVMEAGIPEVARAAGDELSSKATGGEGALEGVAGGGGGPPSAPTQ